MLVTTQAIVLNYTKYSDSAIILHVFTKHYGRQSVLVYGVSGRKRNKINYFQSLFLLDMVMYFKPENDLQKLKEFKINPPLYELTANVYKSSLAIFIAEVLSKCLKESAHDNDLYQFIISSIQVLNHLEKGLGLFHLSFLLKLSRYLGFPPQPLEKQHHYFDLKTDNPCSTKPPHQYYLNQTEHQKLDLIGATAYPQLHTITWVAGERDKLLEATLTLYEFHVANFGSLKSYPVLKDVFSEE